MRKIIIVIGLILSTCAVSAQFQTTDSLERFINRYIRNSAVEAFQNLRLNTAMIGMTKFIDSAYGGQVKSFDKVNDTTIRIITIGDDTLSVTINPGGVTLVNASGGGDTLITSDSKVKRLEAGYGISRTTSATTITDAIDTTGPFSLVPQERLRDTAAAIRAAIGSGSTDTTSLSNRINQKAGKIRLSEYGIISDADISYGSSTFGTDQTAAIQAILNTASATNPLYIIWDVRVSVTGLQIKSYTTIECTKNSGAILRDNSDNFLLRSYVWTPPFSTISNSNIKIVGGIWNGNGYRGGVARQIHSNTTLGMITGFNFGGCENVTLQDVAVINTRTYAIMFLRVDNLYIDHLVIDQAPGGEPFINQDGMDIIGRASNITIKNCMITCGDDRIAFASNAAGGNNGSEFHEPYTGVDGDQVGIRIENIYFKGEGKGLRFNSSANKIEDVFVSNIYGYCRTYWTVMETLNNLTGYTVTPGNADFRNFTYENIDVEIDTVMSYDYMPDIHGHAQIGGNVNHLVFKNVFRKSQAFDLSSFAFHDNYDTVVINDVVIDGFNAFESGSTFGGDHVRLMPGDVTINGLKIINSHVIQSGNNGADIVAIGAGATVNKLVFQNVSGEYVASFLDNSGTVGDVVSASLIRHIGNSNPTFSTSSTILGIILSNYQGATPTSGTFTNTSGDAFSSASILSAILSGGNTTGGTAIRHSTAGTNRDVNVFATPVDDNFAALGVRPASGTNVASELFFAPRGTGYGSGTIRSGVSLFGTDYFADINNWDRINIRVSDSANVFNAQNLGTGTLKPMHFLINGINAMKIGTDRNVQFFQDAIARGVRLTAQAGTGEGAYMYNNGGVANFSRNLFYPSAGTNVGLSFNLVPRGTGYDATTKAVFSIYNTDYVADAVNHEKLQLISAGTDGYLFNSSKNGTGTTRNIRFQLDASDKFTINSTGIAVTGRSSFSDTAALTARFSYGTNLGSTFTRYSLVTKHYVDSAVGAGGGGGLSGSGTSGQLALWNGTSSFTGNASILWGTSNGPRISIGTTNTQGVLNVGGDKNLTSSGIQSYFAGATYTNTTTAASGTASSATINYIASPTIAATNTGVTFPAIVTLGVDAPTAGTNATITRAFAFQTGTNGHANIQGNMEVDGALMAGGAQYNHVTTITATGTIPTNVYWIEVNATSGNITLTLPAASSVFTGARGIIYKLARVDASGNTVTIQRDGSDTIGAAGTSFSLNTTDEVTSIQCVANNKWRVF